MRLRATIMCVLTAALAIVRASGGCAAETLEFRIVHQPGIAYLQELLMEDRKRRPEAIGFLFVVGSKRNHGACRNKNVQGGWGRA